MTDEPQPLADSSLSAEAERERAKPRNFYAALEELLPLRGLSAAKLLRSQDDGVARHVLAEYGAMFVAEASVRVPPVCVFESAKEVAEFQSEAGWRSESFGAAQIELQPAAMEALLAACREAESVGLSITPRDGAEAGRRTYDDTLRLWRSRFLPALEHWTTKGRLSAEEAARLRSLAPSEQAQEVLKLEAGGIFFSKDFSKPVLRSVAAPGASPHLSMYAFDAEEFAVAGVREILARHGWFQTVWSDLPHFTYLGVTEDELPARGLRRAVLREQLFWIPALD